MSHFVDPLSATPAGPGDEAESGTEPKPPKVPQEGARCEAPDALGPVPAIDRPSSPATAAKAPPPVSCEIVPDSSGTAPRPTVPAIDLAVPSASHPPSPATPPRSPGSPASPSQAAAQELATALPAPAAQPVADAAEYGAANNLMVVHQPSTDEGMVATTGDPELTAAIAAALAAQLHVHATPRPSANAEEGPGTRLGREGVPAAAEIEGASPKPLATSGTERLAGLPQALLQRARALSAAVLGAGSATPADCRGAGAQCSVAGGHVSFSDIAQNPRLALAARAELDGGPAAEPDKAAPGATAPGSTRQAEVERTRAAVEGLDGEAKEQADVGRVLAARMCERLDHARRAAERLLGVLQALAAAELAYARAMTAASKVALAGESDGAPLRAALGALSDLPFMVGQGHGARATGVGDALKVQQELVGALRGELGEVAATSLRVSRGVDAARRTLQIAFHEHRAACRHARAALLLHLHAQQLKRPARPCRTADEASGAAGRGSRAVGGAAADPWLTECRVVQAHAALHAAQAAERGFLALALRRTREAEQRRVAAARSACTAFLAAYRAGLAAVRADTSTLRNAIEAADCDDDLAGLVADADLAATAGEDLAARQADALETASQELLCSPEIIRQGEMARWASGTGRWADCHFLLTRAGFLHWFAEMGDLTPLDTVSLARCAFEDGEAPSVRLIEMGVGLFARPRTLVFRAPSVEDCCEWAIALREMIAKLRP